MESIAKLVCSSCGASANASCNCGVAYVPAGKRAETAVRKSPSKSDRAIAKELGVGSNTVRRARSTAPNGAVGKRIGLDGKTRKLPYTPRIQADVDTEVNLLHRELQKFSTAFQEKARNWLRKYPKASKDAKNCLTNILWIAADDFNCLAQEIDGRPCEGPRPGALILQ